MAQRGIAMVNSISGWQSSGVIRINASYQGFQSVDESIGLYADVTPSLLSGTALKTLLKTMIVTWYSNNPSSNYSSWSNLLDDFVLLGGVL